MGIANECVLACACLCNANNVFALDSQWNGLLLDRRRYFEFNALKYFQYTWARNAKAVKKAVGGDIACGCAELFN